MERQNYKWLLMICFLALSCQSIVAGNNKDKNQDLTEKIRVIEKTFEVNPDAIIKLENKYGKVHVNSWDKNVVDLNIEIKVMDKNEEKAEDRLNDIDIEITSNSNLVEAITILESKWFNPETYNLGPKRKVEINYTVNMPANARLDLVNRFGNTYIGKLGGRVDVEIKYGNLKIDELTSPDVEIDLAYGNGEVEEIRFGDVNVRYSNFEVEKSENLNLESKYSNVSIEEVDYLDANFTYGNLEIESIISLQGEMRYSGVEIEELLNDMSIDIRFAPKFKVKYISSEFEKIDIDAEFTSIHLNFQEGSGYELEASANYGNIKASESTSSSFNHEKDDHGPGESVEAIYGSGSKKVNIDVSYGNIVID